MSSLVHSPFEENWGTQSNIEGYSPEICLPSFFKTIPPERIGLNGEYDHSGLAKRVDQAFRQKFESSYLEQLTITQRGRVIVLTGTVLNQLLLEQLIAIALGVVGANQVETQGVALVEKPCLAASHSYS